MVQELTNIGISNFGGFLDFKLIFSELEANLIISAPEFPKFRFIFRKKCSRSCGGRCIFRGHTLPGQAYRNRHTQSV